MALKKLGHRAHIHEWEINAGDDIYAWTEARQALADRLVMLTDGGKVRLTLDEVKARFAVKGSWGLAKSVSPVKPRAA
jgi:hypothetical protein